MTASSSSGEPGVSSPVRIVANIFIAFIGAGVLGLPYAFKEAGILEGTLIMIAVGIISLKAMLLLVDCKYRIIERWQQQDSGQPLDNGGSLFSFLHGPASDRLDLLRNEELLVTSIKEQCRPIPTSMTSCQDISYGDVGYEAIGPIGRVLVDFTLVLSQIGFCCAYLIFICRNMSDLLPQIEMAHWLLIVLPVLCLLCFLRHLKSLTLTSLLAQCSVVFALSVVFWFDFQHFRSARIHPQEISFENIPFFTVIAVYCFEGAGLILSLEGSLAADIRPKFSKYLISTVAAVTVLYVSFGVCGYLSFGTDTNQIITLNLPKSSGFDFSLVVKSCLCLALFLTYPVMMFPVMKILDHYFLPDSGLSVWKGNVLRALVVLLTGGIVILIPNFADLMALVGACCCTLLLFIMPGLFHLFLFKGHMGFFRNLLDWALIFIGVLGTIFGIWNAAARMSGAETTAKASSEFSTVQGILTITGSENIVLVQNTTQAFIQNSSHLINHSENLLLTTGSTSVVEPFTKSLVSVANHLLRASNHSIPPGVG